MSLSLTGTISTCAVNTAYANRLQSDRFENPDTMVCPVWNGLDQYGRVVCYDSYVTKTAGCESALDRVAVENYLRPQYIEFVPLDAQGFLSPAVFGQSINPSVEGYQKTLTLSRLQDVKSTYNKGGSVGISYSSTNAPLQTGQCGVDGGSTCNGNIQKYPNNVNLGVSEGYDNIRPNRNFTRENYENRDNQSSRNFQDRRNLSSIAGYKSNCYACSAGNR